jgi:hypothetical protein
LHTRIPSRMDSSFPIRVKPHDLMIEMLEEWHERAASMCQGAATSARNFRIFGKFDRNQIVSTESASGSVGCLAGWSVAASYRGDLMRHRL